MFLPEDEVNGKSGASSPAGLKKKAPHSYSRNDVVKTFSSTSNDFQAAAILMTLDLMRKGLMIIPMGHSLTFSDEDNNNTNGQNIDDDWEANNFVSSDAVLSWVM